MSEHEVLIFLHLPKTAGTTFHQVLEREFPDRRHFCAFGNGFKQLNGLRHLSQDQINAIDIVRGHVNYGIHRYFTRPCRYITFLRDPVARIVSHYAYIQSNRHHPLHNHFICRPFSLRDFLHKSADNDNGQVRALCGLSNTLSLFDGPRIPIGCLTAGHLHQALENLQSFASFGIQERFDESLLLLKHRLGLDFPLYISENVGNRANAVQLSQEDEDYLRETNQLDLALYDHACKLFDAAIRERADLIDIELPCFLEMNKLYIENHDLSSQHRDTVLAADDYRESLQMEISVLQQEMARLQQKNDDLTSCVTRYREENGNAAKVSVIIPTYNRAHLVGDSIRSVLAQTYDSVEVIVVDDGSTDDTAEVIAAISDPRLRYIRQPNRGRSNARNHALSLARGRYIAFLDSDDLFLPDKLERQVTYLRDHPGVGMVYTSAHCIDQQGTMLEHKYLATVSGYVYEKIAFFTPVTITLPTVMTYRDIMSQVGGFDEAMYRFEDTDMWRRISKVCRVDAMPDFTCLLRTHNDNTLVNQNAGQIAAAVDYYAAKILRDDEDIDLSVRRHGLAGLYRYYGHALCSVPEFSEIGKRLLRTAKDYDSKLINSDSRPAYLVRIVYYRWGLNRLLYHFEYGFKWSRYWGGVGDTVYLLPDTQCDISPVQQNQATHQEKLNFWIDLCTTPWFPSLSLSITARISCARRLIAPWRRAMQTRRLLSSMMVRPIKGLPKR